MKILYLGTVCNIDNYERIIEKCRIKPTIATIVFESALLEGFYHNNMDVDVVSYPMIPNYRHSKILYWGYKKEDLECGYTSHWLKTWNIMFLKQISRRISGKKVIKEWLEKNKNEDCIVMTYGIPPFLAKDVITLSKKYGARNCAIVPDLPRDMYINSSKHFIKSRLRQKYLQSTLAIQGEFDCYVYLTKAMSEVINPHKPFIVMEGILRNTLEEKSKSEKKATPKGIMYAGSMHHKFGVINLIDAFEEADIPNTELWLFGDGNAVEAIREREVNNPRIRLFGRVSRETVLKYEKEATLLVNPRSIKDDFTKYSFPSKTIEYMYSGTPLLTTKLKGIPEEYYQYVFAIEDNEVYLLAHALKEIISLPDKVLFEKGDNAKRYVTEQKNAKFQSKRIIEFLADKKE